MRILDTNKNSCEAGRMGLGIVKLIGARPRPPAAAFYSMLVLLVASNEPQ